MEINTKIILAGVLCIIILGVVVLTFYNPNNAKNIIFDSIEKQRFTNNISITFERARSVNNNFINEKEVVVRHGKNYYSKATINSAITECYYLNNTYYMCVEQLGHEKVCANIGNSTFLKSYVQGKENFLPSDAALDKSKTYFETLFSTNGYMLKQTNTNCVHLMIDFKSIAPSKLQKMGVGSSTFILNSKDYEQELCYDSEKGYPIYSKISYELNTKKYEYENNVTELKLLSDEIVMPELNGEIEDILSFMSDMDKLYVCTFSSDRDGCLWQNAYERYNPLFCMQITDNTKRKGCLFYLASYVLDPVICSYEFSGSALDECYDTMARAHLAEEVCILIDNATKKNECAVYVNTTVQNIEDKKLASAKCFTDADCHITGGLDQYCKSLNITKNSTTYYHIQECLPPYQNITSCVCQDYKCMWEPTDEYRACYDEMDALDTKDYLENLMNQGE